MGRRHSASSSKRLLEMVRLELLLLLLLLLLVLVVVEVLPQHAEDRLLQGEQVYPLRILLVALAQPPHLPLMLPLQPHCMPPILTLPVQ